MSAAKVAARLVSPVSRVRTWHGVICNDASGIEPLLFDDRDLSRSSCNACVTAVNITANLYSEFHNPRWGYAVYEYCTRRPWQQLYDVYV